MSAIMQDSHHIQGSEAWLNFRKKKIGGSDAPIIMGLSPWKTPYQLWMEKLDLVPQPSKTMAMTRGIEMEGAARAAFSQDIGIEVEPRVLVHGSYSWMMASLDGIDKDKKNAVEIKCPMNEKDRALAKEGKVPEKYFPQLQHQMEVAELDSIYYYSFDGKKGDIVIVHRDDNFIKKLLKEEEEFYECMVTLVSPKLLENDYEEIHDAEWESTVAEWKPIRDQLIILENHEKQLREKMFNIASGKNIRGAGVKLTKCVRKGAIEYCKIPELKGLNLEKYRKESVEFYKISEA